MIVYILSLFVLYVYLYPVNFFFLTLFVHPIFLFKDYLSLHLLIVYIYFFIAILPASWQNQLLKQKSLATFSHAQAGIRIFAVVRDLPVCNVIRPALGHLTAMLLKNSVSIGNKQGISVDPLMRPIPLITWQELLLVSPFYILCNLGGGLGVYLDLIFRNSKPPAYH